jgi:hypothetical protein
MKKTKIFFILFCLIFFANACKKDKPDVKFGSINITDAFSLVLCKNDSVTGNPRDTLKLYKITADDKLYRVQYYAEDGANIGFTYFPAAMYDINKNYFLLILSKDASETTIAYIISKSDGTAEELQNFEIPAINRGSGPEINQSNRIFIKANAKNFFYLDENNVNKLSFDAANYPTSTFMGDYSPNFTVDSLGDFILGKKLYCQPAQPGNDIISYTIDEIDENTLISGNNSQGFYMIQRDVPSVLITKLNISNYNYSLAAKGEIAENIGEWNYLGNAVFCNSQSVIFVFDEGLLFINPTMQKIIPLSEYSLAQIIDFTQSNNYLYIHGLNSLQNELFVKINPSTYPLTYSHIFNPGQYHYHQYQLDETGNFSFFAKRNSDAVDVIGYLSASQYVNIVDNDQKLEPRQILSLK